MFIKSKELNNIFSQLEKDKYITSGEMAYYALFNNQKIIGMLEFSEKLNSRQLEFLELSI